MLHVAESFFVRWDVVCARACDGPYAGTRFECGFGFARAAGEGHAHLTDALVLLCVLRFSPHIQLCIIQNII